MRIVFDNPYEIEGNWFKGNIHTHTTNSDGNMTPEQVCKRYKDAEYDFLAITDHGIMTDANALSGLGILMISGEEICAGSSNKGSYYHILGLNLQEDLPLKDFQREENPQRVIDLIKEQDGLAILAHPYWSELIFEDLYNLKGYSGVEVYNTTCDYTIGKGYSNVHWDDLLNMGKKILGFAVDDAHCLMKHLLPLDICEAWINVKAASLTVPKIIDSIEKGLFYSSNGPELKDIKIDRETIEVISSPVKSIAFISNGICGENNSVREGFIEEARFDIKGSEIYVRIEVTDWKGRKAWSNPIYFDF
jgi:hypothetical protein